MHNYDRVAILDLDVHQGDGTATILQNIDGALTISLHCQENFPFRKAVSDHDLELKANSNDEQFLHKVNQAIDIAIKFNPQLILYQAGVDGLATDALGKLNITREGMSERNKLVFEMAVKNSIPTVVFMGGGYSKPISHTIDAFCDLFTAAAEANNRFTNTANE